MSERAHARRDDPGTSHDAAAAITPGLPALQRLVEDTALNFSEGFTDVDLCFLNPEQGPSTLRSRRAELCARNIILDSGRRVIPEGHTQRHTVWLHRSFVPQPPPILEPNAPGPGRDEALLFAAKLDGYAATQKAEGRSFLSEELARAAAMIRSLV